jgi:3'-5' exoribonuclease
MRKTYLRDCQPGDVAEDVFVITGKQLAQGQNGKHYIKAFVSDRTAQVTARMWNATREIFNALPDGGFLRIRARVENYQNNLQLILEQTWPAKEGTFEIGDLLPQTTKDIAAMCRKLQELLGSIQNRHLAALVQAYIDDEKLMGGFCKAPAAMSFHHAFIGGLLEHTLNAIEVADSIVRFYPGLNRDLVITGIFLHDIAKSWELCYECAFGYTDGGQLVGHIVKSAMWVEHKAKDAEKLLGGEPIPQPLIDVLQHIILSHHGEVSDGFGSAKSPATPEAIAVHYIENMDAKLTMSLAACRGDASGAGSPAAGTDGNWTEYMKAFAGRLYRPDVAPPDAPAVEPVPDVPQEGPPEPTPLRLPPSGNGAAHGAAHGSAPAEPLKITNPLFESSPLKQNR